MQDAVDRAIVLIRERFYDPLTLDDIARAGFMSRFHFSRVFRRTTGISPGRFLAAVRLHEAKRLLLTSSTSVADISCLVGYTSLGTFTTRFTGCVGVSPGRFRRLAELGLLAPVQASTGHTERAGFLTGTLRVDHGAACGPIFMGLFDRPIPQGKPEICMTIPAAGEWLLDPVPEGEWYVMAVTLSAAGTSYPHLSAIEWPMLIGSAGPVTIQARGLRNIDVNMHEPRPTDPPVLVTLPELLRVVQSTHHVETAAA